MIATLSGKVLLKGADRVVIDVAGVGYEVFLSADGISRLPDRNEETFLHIHTHVREDAILLYGFIDEAEKEMFLILKTVSGIGPKLALAILSGMRVGELSAAIVTQDVKRLTGLPGVGKRTAERLCVELKEKVGHLGTMEEGGIRPTVSMTASAGSLVADALSVFSNLGYPDPVARQALTAVKRRVGDERFAALHLEELIKEGLRALA
ncbi:MAG: Holliday junction branch migration protein RuvA [Desulfocapsaceae bacterium]|nr:Holliday junction branch migration protein RuvA [Desulfocapsaceae bacterium]